MKNNKGITIVALICTVIVMLILLGVSIRTILKDDGVTKTAQNAVEEVQKKINEENEWAQNMIDEF